MTLAARCRRGEPGAFEALYQAHAPRLFGLACRMVGRTEAEDLLQEIFLSVHKKIGLYKGEAALGTWLFRLATNACLDFLRSRSARFAKVAEPVDEQADLGGTPGPILGVVDRIDLDYALSQLPEGLRVVFVLHDVEGLEHKEVGRALGIAEGTSKAQLHKARMRLRALLSTRHSHPDTRPDDVALFRRPIAAE